MARNRTRRRLLQVAASAAVTSLAGCASVVDSVGQNRQSAGKTTPTTVADTPTSTSTPDQQTEQPKATEAWSTEEVTIGKPAFSLDPGAVPKETTYARMGEDDAPVATLYGNWKCPYTREFVVNQMPGLVEEFVQPGRLRLEFRSLAYRNGSPYLGPDAPRATRAGLAVWHLDPASYWTYFAYVFANQPAEKHAWAQPSLLERFAEAAGVSSPSAIERRSAPGNYEDLLGRSVDDAAALGIGTVPRIAVDDTVTAPTIDPESTREQLERAAEKPKKDEHKPGDEGPENED